jgi:hypothetical protein
MMNETKAMTQQTYNGWANYETWNVSLWMQNNQFLYNTAVACVEYHNVNEESPYIKFIRCMDNCDKIATADDVRWDSLAVDHDEINAMMFEIHEGGEV